MMNNPEPEFVVSDLDPDRMPAGRFSRRRGLMVQAVAGVALLAILGIAMQRAWPHPPHMATAYPVFTALPPGTPVPTRVPPPGQGWVNAGPAIAQDIVFAPSAPQTAYSCGVVTPNEGAPQPVIVGISHDGGATWHTKVTSIPDTGCHISVDPLDAQDVVLAAGRCAGCPQPWLVRSRDGGVTWAVPSLPPHGSTAFSYMQLQWAGDDLYIALAARATGSTSDVYRSLAVSRAGGPLQWVDDTKLFAHLPADAQITQMLAIGHNLMVSMSTNQCPPACATPKLTTTHGATWQSAPPFTVEGTAINLIGSTLNGQILFGHIGMGPGGVQMARSQDGGATWTLLPPFPAGTLYDYLTGQTPDGTLFVELQFDDQMFGIFDFTSTRGTWQLAASTTTGNVIITVSADVGGHPQWLWGQAMDLDETLGHVQRHAP